MLELETSDTSSGQEEGKYGKTEYITTKKDDGKEEDQETKENDDWSYRNSECQGQMS